MHYLEIQQLFQHIVKLLDLEIHLVKKIWPT